MNCRLNTRRADLVIASVGAGLRAFISVGAEQSALGKLLANWSAVMEGQQVKADKRAGQERFL